MKRLDIRLQRQSIEKAKSIKTIDSIQILADELLLQRFAPASVLINEQGDILYITGRTGKYLEPAAGKANMNIFKDSVTGFIIVFKYTFL
jgi:two-component system CheB/CheR fusion protein